MPTPKSTFEQFLETVPTENKTFVQTMHNYMLEHGCKATIEEKKNGFFASYKHGKPLRATFNFLFKKQALHARIYGERISTYPNFLNNLPVEMVQAIDGSAICGKLVNNMCSVKCTGYDFFIAGKHYQQCRYNCFEFQLTAISSPYIKQFVENEIAAR